jgi:hypothetical protein
MNKYFKIFFAFIFYLLLISFYIIVHESTHKTINDYYGFNSSFGISFDKIYTIAHIPDDVDNALLLSWRHSQDMVDVVGYHLFCIYIILIFIFIKDFKKRGV